ncbi:MAG: glycosyltransferase family 39 protein [Terriglobales bacterium]
MKRGLLIAAWLALAWVMLGHGLGALGLIGPDEPRYAAIAAAMWRHHDFLTPRLWGATWLEKPVLLYWLAALADGLLGVGAAASRLPNALLAAALSAMLGWFLARVHSARAGWLAAFLSLTSVFIFGFGRAATTDMTLTAPLTAAMVALYVWQRDRRERWLLAAAAALALATLAKGPVALALAGLIWLGFCWSQGAWRLFPAPLRPGPIVIYGAIAAPWYAAMAWVHPGFFRTFFLQQNLERFASNRYQHPQPFWFYVPVLLLALAPWSGWLGLPLLDGLRRWRRRGWRQLLRGRDAPLPLYLFWWLVTPLVFFSLAQSKLPGYILPAVPAAVALIAVSADASWEQLPRWPLLISAVLAGLVPGAIVLAPAWLTESGAHGSWPLLWAEPWAWVLSAAAVAAMCVLAYRRRPEGAGPAAALAATCLLMAGGLYTLTRPPLSPVLDAALSGRGLARQLTTVCGSGLPAHCGAAPLFDAGLNRGLLYGAQFELGGELKPWPAAVPAGGAWVVLDRRALETFSAGKRVSMPPGGEPAAARWVLVRVGGKKVGSGK